MRVKIKATIEVSDEQRRGLAWHLGKSGLATRAEVRDHYLFHASVGADDLDEWAVDAVEDDWIKFLRTAPGL